MNKKERRLALATAFQSATANTVIVEDLKVRSTASPVGRKPAKLTVDSAQFVAAITDLHCQRTANSPAAITS